MGSYLDNFGLVVDKLFRDIVGNCKICSGLGYRDLGIIALPDLVPATEDCQCISLFRDVVRSQLSGIPIKFRDIIKEDIIEKKCREYNFIDESKNPIKKLFKNFLFKYIDGFDNAKKYGYSFMFFGPNGCGKTFSAIYILKNIPHKYYCYYIAFRELLELGNFASFGKLKEDRDKYYYICSVDLLCIDEVGKESSITSNVLFGFERLLKCRLERNLPTIIISNKTVVDFFDSYSEITSLFEETYKVILFDPRVNMRKTLRLKWEL